MLDFVFDVMYHVHIENNGTPKGGICLSNAENKQAQTFRETLARLPESDRRYIEGWMAAKADTHKTEKKKED